MAVANYKILKDAVTLDKIKDVYFTVDIPVLMSDVSVSAEASGTVDFAHSTIQLDSNTIKLLSSAKVILDYTWADTADGTIQLYDATAGEVLGESSSKTGGESSEWEEFDVTGTLTAGNSLNLRANITAAGGTGETVTVHRAILRLTLKL